MAATYAPLRDLQAATGKQLSTLESAPMAARSTPYMPNEKAEHARELAERKYREAYEGVDSNDHARQAYRERFMAIRFWFTTMGFLRFLAGLIFIIIVPVLGHHYTVNIRINLYSVVNSWTYDLFFVIAAGSILIGILYGLLAIPAFWKTVENTTLTHNVNGYAHLMDGLESAFVMFVLAQVVGITDLFFLLALVFARLAASFLNYSSDMDNADAMVYPDGIRLWHNSIFSVIILLFGAWLPIFAYFITYNTYLNGLDPLLYTDYYRAWFVLAFPIVAAVVDVVFNTVLGWFRFFSYEIKTSDRFYYNLVTNSFINDPSRYDAMKAVARTALYLFALVSMFVIALDGH